MLRNTKNEGCSIFHEIWRKKRRDKRNPGIQPGQSESNRPPLHQAVQKGYMEPQLSPAQPPSIPSLNPCTRCIVQKKFPPWSSASSLPICRQDISDRSNRSMIQKRHGSCLRGQWLRASSSFLNLHLSITYRNRDNQIIVNMIVRQTYKQSSCSFHVMRPPTNAQIAMTTV